MKLVTTSQMKAIESQADASGLTYAQMMENAGRAVAEAVVRKAKCMVLTVKPADNDEAKA